LRQRRPRIAWHKALAAIGEKTVHDNTADIEGA
jgi:hypothetical protein